MDTHKTIDPVYATVSPILLNLTLQVTLCDSKLQIVI